MNDFHRIPLAGTECSPGKIIPDRWSIVRTKKALRRFIYVAVMTFGLCGAILPLLDAPVDGRVPASADGTASYDSVHDDSAQDPLLAVPRFPFYGPGKSHRVFLSGAVRLPSLTIAPLSPPPKI